MNLMIQQIPKNPSEIPQPGQYDYDEYVQDKRLETLMNGTGWGYSESRQHLGIPEPSLEPEHRPVTYGEVTPHVDPEQDDVNKRNRALAEEILKAAKTAGYKAPKPHQVMDSRQAGSQRSPYAKFRGPAA